MRKKEKKLFLMIVFVYYNLILDHGNYLQESYDVGRLPHENLRETFQEQLNTNFKSLEFDNVEDGWNNFRKTLCEVADGVLGKKVRTAAGNISEKLYV
jgi:hypothetical protein